MRGQIRGKFQCNWIIDERCLLTQNLHNAHILLYTSQENSWWKLDVWLSLSILGIHVLPVDIKKVKCQCKVWWHRKLFSLTHHIGWLYWYAGTTSNASSLPVSARKLRVAMEISIPISSTFFRLLSWANLGSWRLFTGPFQNHAYNGLLPATPLYSFPNTIWYASFHFLWRWIIRRWMWNWLFS